MDLDGRAPRVRCRIRDRGTQGSGPFDPVRRSEGMLLSRTPVQAPPANAHAERVLETMWAEWLDWTRILGRRHLDRTLRTDAAHDHRGRPHRALGLTPPLVEAGRRSRSTRAMVAGWICSLDASTRTTAPRRDRIGVSDPHGVAWGPPGLFQARTRGGPAFPGPASPCSAPRGVVQWADAQG
jgi:hypothetical protein